MVQDAKRITPFFENLATVPMLITELERWFKRPFHRNTVYRWVKQGMPCRKLPSGLYFPLDEVALWLDERAKKHGHL